MRKILSASWIKTSILTDVEIDEKMEQRVARVGKEDEMQSDEKRVCDNRLEGSIKFTRMNCHFN